MATTSFLKFYRVFKNDTAVTEILTNDFKPVKRFPFKSGQPNGVRPDLEFGYKLPKDESMFYGYTSKIKAMEKAKSGALAHINRMILDVNTGIQKLKDYRNNHYQDLNITLLDSNIRKIESLMNIK